MSQWGQCIHGRVGFCGECGNLPKPSVDDLQEEIDALKAAITDRDAMHAQHVQALEVDRMRLRAALEEAKETFALMYDGEGNVPSVYMGMAGFAYEKARKALGKKE